MSEPEKPFDLEAQPEFQRLSPEEKTFFRDLAASFLKDGANVSDIPDQASISQTLDPATLALIQALDESITGAKKIVADSEKLITSVEQSHAEFETWRQDNGFTDEVVNRFFDGLSPEGKQKVREEEEAFDREAQAELQAARDKAGPGAPEHVRKQRKFM